MWTITEDSFYPAQLHHKETIFTIGNGYLSTRGTFEEGYPTERRATFVHGVFDDVPIVFTELVNVPDWLPFEIYVDGERFSQAGGTLVGYKRTLNLRTGLLTRSIRWTSPGGKTVRITFERFASQADEHLLCLRSQIVSNYDGRLEIRLGLNGYTENEGFTHLQWLNQGRLPENIVYLYSKTRKTGIGLALAMVVKTSQPAEQDIYCDTQNQPTRFLDFSVKRGDVISIEKIVGIATSRDTTDPVSMAVEHAKNYANWEQAFTAHRLIWQAYWNQMDVLIEGDVKAQLAVRASLFQLYIAAPRHDDRVNIGSKTLSGFGYRGHSFWDTEQFMLPVFIYTAPEIARNLLNYRYQRLEAAHDKARQNGYQGAQFPWESADTGEEVTPTWVPDFYDRTKLVRIWTGDIEIHISADIAYAACLYWRVTADDDWFIGKGAELVLDTAKFWASRAEWNAKNRCFEYTDVIGPDEYHDHVDNNFYTNYMARWNLQTALEVLGWLESHAPEKAKELLGKLELTEDILTKWRKVISRMYLPIRSDSLIEQFEGYFKRTDIDLAALEPREISAQVLFGIEGCNETQVIKQPDVLMLMHLMPNEFDPALVRVNYDYYTPRTDLTFGSSLGPTVQSILASRLGDRQCAYQFFMEAARADLEDLRGNAGDGVHGASAGGIWQAVVFGIAGLCFDGDTWNIEPHLPDHWKRLKFKFFYRGKLQTVDIQNHLHEQD
jgi:kojibiose phosphorylase